MVCRQVVRISWRKGQGKIAVRECGSKGRILTTQGIAKHFGGLAALKDINLEIERGSITGIIGPNGSGKTTLFNVITGYLKATKGNVFYEEEKITGVKPYEIVNKGIARTFQVPQCCKLLTIRENIRLACLSTYSGETIEVKTREFAAVAKIDRHLEIEAKNVPIGFLRKTEIAMALATNPRLLLLDEPFSGLTDLECQEFSAIVKGVRENITLVVIDHKLKHLMPIVEKVYVLNEGRVFFAGSPDEVARNRDVQKDLYWGGGSVVGGNASLTIKGLEAGYGEVPVLMGIDIKIDEKEMVAIVGPNGAGKSTLLRCISGLIERRAGEIRFLNRKIDELNCDDIVKLGIIYCPEGGKVFPEMNVEDNLLIGGYLQRRIERIKQMDLVYHLFPRLRERRNQLAGTLSGGERQMVSLGLSLMSKPRLFMMDEPSLGLAPILKKAIFETIGRIKREQRMAILLVEQDAFVALELAERSYVLDNGRIALEANSKALLEDAEFKRIYLGI